ncbi:hypothetical protein [uncultured Duncaniella sp.]|uniref:hypothetical protein n=1 Tax=uncultured Duncaniella sp. TaxID=2768039 RepID=UPI0025B6FD3A|nr:hypothetical protein [uncultured Duncaniella sp.]
MFRFGYFDSDIIGIDDEGMPIFDRAELSDLFALLFASLVSDGVLALPNTCFKIRAAGNGLNIERMPGFGMVKGHFCYDDESDTMTLTAPQTYSRIDRVIMRLNLLDRMVEIIIKQGEEAAKPQPPELIRPAAGDYFELCLAEITLTPKQTTITQSSINDTRANSSVCGFITQLIDHIDTSVFYAQFDAFYTEFVRKSDTAYGKFVKDFNDRYALFDKMAQDAYDAYAHDIDEYAENIKSLALSKYLEVSETVDNFYRKITQEGQELSDEYHKKMTDLSDTFEKDAAKQYDRTWNILTGLANRAMDVYDQFSTDTFNFYNDISRRGEQRYREFDSEIDAYIKTLRAKGDGDLADITQVLLTWQTEHQNEFIEWLDRIKGNLTEDQAGKLQLAIDDQAETIDLILEMLYSGTVMAPIITDDGYQIVDEEGTPVMMDEPMCKCTENAKETRDDIAKEDIEDGGK